MTDNQIIQMFSDLTFDSQKHLYYWNKVRVPLSVTGIVNKLSPKFNTEVMSRVSARKQTKETGEVITAHELKHKWQTISTAACDLGTKVHSFMERFTGIETPKCPQEVAGIKYIKDLEGKYEISFRELRAYSRKYNYAGTMDIPLRYINKPIFIIDDYKTNGNLFKTYNYLNPPFDFLEDTPYNKYQIQLSLYQIMLEEIGLEVDNRRLVHLRADGEYKAYPLIDFTSDLKDYLKTTKLVAA